MESWQDEIIKAQISQEIGVERSMENSDTSIFLKSFEENLISCVDRDSFDKSWSSDLAKKFPEGGWRTINGASVFINNGKVIAGLDGFNKEIGTFFEQKGKKAEGEKKESEGSNVNANKELLNELNESHKTGKELSDNFYDKFTKLSKEDQSRIVEATDSHKFAKDKREALEKILRSGKEKPKTTEKEEAKDEPLENWQEVQLNDYNKDKSGYIKRTLETASAQSERAKKQLNDWIGEAKNKEYKDMLLNIKSEFDKVEEKAKNQSDKLEAEKKNIANLTDSETFSLSPEKMMQGDVYGNFKQYNEYVKAARKEKKHKDAGFIVPNYEGQEKLFKEKTTALKKERDIKVRQEDSHKALIGVAAKDELRPYMNGVYYDPDGYEVSTDAHTMLAVETDTKENSGKIIGRDGKEIEGHFPNWRGVVPERYTESVNLDLSDIHSLSKQAKDIGSWVNYKQVTVSLSDSINAKYSADRVLAITTSLRKLGVENVKASYSSDESGTRALRLDGKTKDGKSVVGLLMPMYLVSDQKATFKLEKQ